MRNGVAYGGGSNMRYNKETDMVQIYFEGKWVDWKAGNLMTYEDLTKLAGIGITASSSYSSSASGTYGPQFMLVDSDTPWYSATNAVTSYFTIYFPSTVKVNSILLSPITKASGGVDTTIDILTAKSGEDFVKLNTYNLPGTVDTTLLLDNIECSSLRVQFNARNFYDSDGSYNAIRYAQVMGRVLE